MYLTARNIVLAESAAVNAWTILGKAGGLRTGSVKNDAFDSLWGDTLAGGAGDDSYNLWDAGSKVVEKAGEGIDTIRVRYWGGITLPDHVENVYLMSGGANWATGNGLSNLIVAGNVGATLDGGGGDDVLVGGAGADLFRVKAGNGSDAINNFQAGWDTVKLDGYGLTSFDQVKAAATQQGQDVSIKLSASETLVLRGVRLDTLTAADFDLATVTAKPAALDKLFTTSGQGWNSKGWYIVNNGWGATGLVEGKDYSLTSAFSSANIVKGATFTWAYPVVTEIATNIRAYPEVVFGHSPLNTSGPNTTDTAHVFPVKVDDLAALTASYDITAKGHLSGFNVAYDIWLSSTPDGTGRAAVTNEVMVWVHKGALEPFGQVIGTYTKGDFTATIYHTGTYTALVADRDVPAGTIDVADILAKLKSMGIVSGGEYLRSVELGSEVTNGKGSLTINDLSLRVETKNASGGTTVKTVTGAGTTVETKGAATTATAAAQTVVTKTDAGGHTVGYDLVGQDGASKTTQHFDAQWKFLGADRQSVDASGVKVVEHFDAAWKAAGADKIAVNADGSTTTQHFNAQWKLTGADQVKVDKATTITSHYDAGWVVLGMEIATVGTDGVTRTDSYNAARKLISTDLTGTDRADTLSGGAGATNFHGGKGADLMKGGAGADTFHFDTAPAAGQADTITGFTVGVDKIALENAVFTDLGIAGMLDASAFVVGTKALDANDRLIFDAAKGDLYYDADGSGSQAAVLLAHIAANGVLGAGDFVIV